MRNSLVAQRYADAVLKNIKQKDHQVFRKDIITLQNIFAEDREYITALNSFLYPLKERLELAEKITESLENSEVWKNLFTILIKKHRFNILSDILSGLDDEILAENNKIKAKITMAFQHDETVEKNIIRKVEEMLGSEIEETIVIDPRIVGGFIAETETMRIDGSIHNNLVRLVETSSKDIK